ncbi:MAG: PAS domain-containing protein, partial [Gammaproteobacteria bacterium]|nr:PAS domain-containing protein [Gammaproteobacteria bacterium]NIR97496.1 PAS domain-containing protein [Gammaproteobacteria bacterium]NIT63134.1 PAS domain-containing protein [Gammaproteobacteria bacterium]NIV20093.1 PAS domain-containing protein [Gammaproteobacteria bacterium]NIY31714.1 PAS domain-containing protein [Gammaproteobacteria bacterium]
GTENIFHLRKLPLRIAETGVNALVIVSENMTEAVQSQRELRESQRLLNTIIDTLPHWISVKNRDGHFRIVNAPLLRAFDADAAQFVGRRSEEVLPVDPEAQDVLRRGNKAVLETGAPYTVPELRLRLPD